MTPVEDARMRYCYSSVVWCGSGFDPGRARGKAHFRPGESSTGVTLRDLHSIINDLPRSRFDGINCNVVTRLLPSRSVSGGLYRAAHEEHWPLETPYNLKVY